MAIPTVYRWDDKNAPVVTDLHDWTQIYDWFQAIFVDGYLEDDDTTPKPGLGWGLVLDDRAAPTTYYADLTQAEKPGVLLSEQNKLKVRFDFNYQCTQNWFSPRYSCWENDDEVVLLFSQGNVSYGTGSVVGQNDDDLKVCPWIVIGTDRGVWMMAGHNHNVPAGNVPADFSSITNYMAFRYFGDYINDGVNLGKNNQLTTSGSPSGQFNTVSAMSTLYSYYYNGQAYVCKTGRNYLNNIQVRNLAHKETIMNNDDYPGAWSYGMKYPYIDGGLYITPWEMWSKEDKVYYGRIPGAYYPLHSKPLNHSLPYVSFTGTGLYEGDEFIGLSDSRGVEFYINISEDWGIGTT